MTSPRIFGMLLVAVAAAALILGSFHNVMASNIITDGAADVDTEEAALAENASMTTGVNETTNENMTNVYNIT